MEISATMEWPFSASIDDPYRIGGICLLITSVTDVYKLCILCTIHSYKKSSVRQELLVW